MSTDTIDHATLCQLADAGAIKDAHVVGQKGGWAIRVRFGTRVRTLSAQRSRQIRLFRSFETLVSYLQKMGISTFDVDAAEYEPKGERTGTRPDRSEALRRVHEAAEHDAWFKNEVELALIEADDPATAWLSQESVKRDWHKRRAELLIPSRDERKP
jgi:hypothetical protein